MCLCARIMELSHVKCMFVCVFNTCVGFFMSVYACAWVWVCARMCASALGDCTWCLGMCGTGVEVHWGLDHSVWIMHQTGPLHLSNIALVCLKLQVPLWESQQHHSAAAAADAAVTRLTRTTRIQENGCKNFTSNLLMMAYLSETSFLNVSVGIKFQP